MIESLVKLKSRKILSLSNDRHAPAATKMNELLRIMILRHDAITIQITIFYECTWKVLLFLLYSFCCLVSSFSWTS
jgi:hypothetical protein